MEAADLTDGLILELERVKFLLGKGVAGPRALENVLWGEGGLNSVFSFVQHFRHEKWSSHTTIGH